MMKKILLATMLAASLAACSKTDHQTEQPIEEGIPVDIVFTQPATRAFFEDTAAAEPWEKEVKSMVILVFDENGDIIKRQILSENEVSTLRGRVLLAKEYAGRTFSIYAVANYTLGNSIIQTESDLHNAGLSEAYYTGYNGSFESVTTGCLREGGIVMTGSTQVVLMPQGQMTNAAIEFKRTVAKIAIEVDIDPDFIASLGDSKFYVTEGGVNNIRSRSYLFPEKGTFRTAPVGKALQTSKDPYALKQQFLVYIFEQGPYDSADDYPNLHISATFNDAGASVGNLTFLKYNAPLTGSGLGEIRRNGYYRLRGTIKDMNTLQLDASFTVADWETPQTEDLGHVIPDIQH